MGKLLHEKESYTLNGIAFRVHKILGRFAKEKQYCDQYENELRTQSINYKRELTIGSTGNRLDFFVYDSIVLEIKARPYIIKEDYYQTQRYLQSLNCELGIIYNFRDQYLKPKRILRETRKNSYPQKSADPDIVLKSGSLSL